MIKWRTLLLLISHRSSSVKAINSVYCPCFVERYCTFRYQDETDCDDSGNTVDDNFDCTNNQSTFVFNHNFQNINGNVAEEITLDQLADGIHCVLEMEYLSYWDGSRFEQPWRNRYSKTILPSLEHQSYMTGGDDCDNNSSSFGTILPENFFVFKSYEHQQNNDNPDFSIPHVFKFCYPTRHEWKSIDWASYKLADELPPLYEELFSQTLKEPFLTLYDEEIQESIKENKYEIYKRRSSWVILGAIFLIIVLIYLIVRHIRKMIAYKRQQHILSSDQPEFLEYSPTAENMLGEGGFGRVYAGRFRGNNVAIKVIDIYSDLRKAERLKMECLILHTLSQHRNEFILQIYSPNVEVVATSDRLDEIVLTKYGWGENKRNLDDLLMEVRRRSIVDETDPDYWSMDEIIDIAWHIVTSLAQGLRQIHFPPRWPTDSPEFTKFVECVVHRDIKNKNIGVRKTPDGKYCCVIADFGLSSICINESGRRHLKKQQKECFPVNHMKIWIDQFIPRCDWLKYFEITKGPTWNHQALDFIQREEQRQTSYFFRHIAPGTNRWRAPEIVYPSKDYYFSLHRDYHCSLGCLGGENEVGSLISSDFCGRCTKEIFRFYRMNDVYGVGLVILSILKTVTEKEVSQNVDYGSSEIPSDEELKFFDKLEDAGTSKEPSVTQEHFGDEFDEFLPEKILEHIQRQSIRNRLDFDNRLRCIRNIAEQCLRPNPYDRPEIYEICEDVTAFENELNGHHDPNRYPYSSRSPQTLTTVCTR